VIWNHHVIPLFQAAGTGGTMTLLTRWVVARAREIIFVILIHALNDYSNDMYIVSRVFKFFP
jgi:hypothetical protein